MVLKDDALAQSTSEFSGSSGVVPEALFKHVGPHVAFEKFHTCVRRDWGKDLRRRTVLVVRCSHPAGLEERGHRPATASWRAIRQDYPP
jgi:hypothetical protein